jgi:hypothetical protein
MSSLVNKRKNNEAMESFFWKIKGQLLAKEQAYRLWDVNSNQVSLRIIQVAQQKLKKLAFVSVYDFASVKQLIQLEREFAKFTELKTISFQECRHYIPPRIHQRAVVEVTLDEFEIKAYQLFSRHHFTASMVAQQLLISLRVLTQDYFVTRSINFHTYRQQALAAIAESKPILEKHRGFKKLLGNLGLFFLTAGIGFIVLVSIHKACTGHFLFFSQTDMSKQLNKLSEIVEYAAKPLIRFY